MNRLGRFLGSILTLFLYYNSHAEDVKLTKSDTIVIVDTLLCLPNLAVLNAPENSKYLIISGDSISHAKFKFKKRVAAILAFPVPFGLLGLHRLILGTKPYIPFVYMGTIGGCFLILPIIDFIAILSSDEETFKKFENNPKVFMWSH